MCVSQRYTQRKKLRGLVRIIYERIARADEEGLGQEEKVSGPASFELVLSIEEIFSAGLRRPTTQH
jgi:hypothetical protein